jgi:hypothetical protein
MTLDEKGPKPAKKPKAKAEKPTKPWIKISVERYQAQAQALVTHSFKGVNTNISPGGGVRVIPKFDDQFPYACAQHARAPVGLTYASNATESKSTEQICAIFEDGVSTGVSQYDSVPLADSQIIREKVLPILLQQAVDAPDFVNPRLRQILVDDGAGGDLCLTPLPSGGMSFRIKRLIESILERRTQVTANGASAPLNVDFVVVKVGGDKLQNAGRATLVGAMQRAYRFYVPAGTDDSMRRAFAIHFRGISITPSRKLVQAYGRWLSGLRAADALRDRKGASKIMRSVPRVEDESVFITAIVNEVLGRGDRARDLLLPYLGKGLATLTHDSVQPTLRGLIDPGLRDEAWKSRFAMEFAREIADVTGRDEVRLAGISGRSARSLETYILEALS